MTGARKEDVELPELRCELTLLPGTPSADGWPTWLIHDPTSNRFTHIDVAAYEALKCWGESKTVGELVRRTNSAGTAHLDADAAMQLLDFLYANHLTVAPRSGGWRNFARMNEARMRSFSSMLVHNYLFFKIPLFRPQSFLERTLPFVRPLWTRFARATYITLFLTGLYLASREWELYFTTLGSYLNLDGVIAGGLALVLVKTAHELGHGYVAVSFGCRVHSMGLAFMVMAPMPYTDVTDAWRLTERRKRLLIDSAGIVTEAAIAAVALFLWAFLPTGPLKNAMFVLSAVSMISTVVVNINPLMRFDGYYIASELIGVENLQARSFRLGTWKLREILFGLGVACPEAMPPARIRMLIAYSWATWIYRLILFTGIALLVYHYFFKVVGVILFLVEIVYFIALPIARELAAWFGLRRQIVTKRRFFATAAVAVAVIVVVSVPISTTVEVPAILEARQVQLVYPLREGKVAQLHVRHGERVEAGEVIATMISPELEADLVRTHIALRRAEMQFARRGSDPIDREGSLVLDSAIESLQVKIAGLEQERGELSLVSPAEGQIVDLNPEMHVGRWISPRDQIAVIAGAGMVAKGYVGEADVPRLEPGASATFIPEHASRPRVQLRLEGVAVGGARQIEVADLASIHGGPLPVNQDEKHRLVPATAQFLATFGALENQVEPELAIRGIVLVEGQAESLAARAWRRAVSVILRESGF